MANQKKRLEFENTFGDSGRSPKRPKLEVIQRPSTSASRNESLENVDENDDLWGDELEDDAVEEALLLESQVCTLKVQPLKPETGQNVTSGVFKPKTAIISSSKHTFTSSKNPNPRNILRGSETTVKETVPRSRVFNSPTPALSVTQPLRVEKVKSTAIGRGCARSNSSPSFNLHHSSNVSSKPVSEVKDSSRKRFIASAEDEFPFAGCSKETEDDKEKRCKILKAELEKLKLETFTNTGEAALLRQKIKDAGLELEKERHERSKIVEKINEKHQQELAALKKELAAAKTQLEFKEHDVDSVVEKFKLLEAGNIIVRPLELKVQSPAGSSSSRNIQSRPMLEDEPKKNANVSSEETPEATHLRPVMHEPEKNKARERCTKKDESNIEPNESLLKIIRLSEGELLSDLIVPHWFENATGVTEELFESKWEGVDAVSALIKQNKIGGYNLDKLMKWLWNRTLKFLSILRNRSEADYKFHDLKQKSVKNYREWCLDRRIPLPQERETIDEYLEDDWFCKFAEQALGDELKWLLNYRPWCPKEALPEIRRTIALFIALMDVSNRTASIFSSHNQSMGINYCCVCDKSLENEAESSDLDEDDTNLENDADDKELTRIYREGLNRSPPCKNELLCRYRGSKDGQNPLSSNKVPETSKEISSKDDSNPASNSEVPKTEDRSTTSDQNPPINSELPQTSKYISVEEKKKPAIEDEDTSSLDSFSRTECPRVPEIDPYVPVVIPDDELQEVDADPRDILEYDFVHLAQQICRAVTRMRIILPFEGILAAVLSFLSTLNEKKKLSERGLLLISGVIKDVLYSRPRLRLLIHLLKLLNSTGRHPFVMQELCINSPWNTAYKDRWKNIWMFTRSACPLQILLVVMENISNKKKLKDCSKVLWIEYRLKVIVSFIKWLHIIAEQPGHLVDWLCYVLDDETEDEDSAQHQKEKHVSDIKRKSVAGAGRESEKKDKADGTKVSEEDDAKGMKESEEDDSAGKHVNEPVKIDDSEGMKEPERKENRSDSVTTEENMQHGEENAGKEVKEMKTKEEEDDTDDNPIKTVYESSSDSLMESDNDENMEGSSKRCCCRRWLMNVLVFMLAAVFSDFQRIIKIGGGKPDYKSILKRKLKKKVKEFRFMTPHETYKEKLVLEYLAEKQTVCLELGLLMIREFLLRKHPEFSIPGGKGFLWNHYTVKGTILHNGQIVMKDYSYKNIPGGPIAGRYSGLLHDLEYETKGGQMEFSPGAEKALEELLEVKNSWQPVSDPGGDGVKDEDYWWDQIYKVNAVKSMPHDDPEIDRQFHLTLIKNLKIDIGDRVFF